MRSRKNEYILTKQEVHDDACSWLGPALRLEYKGRSCTDQVLLRILLLSGGAGRVGVRRLRGFGRRAHKCHGFQCVVCGRAGHGRIGTTF